MTHTFCRSFVAAAVFVVAVLGSTPASAQYLMLTPTVVDDGAAKAAQEGSPAVKPSLVRPFSEAVGDFRRLPNRTNAEWLIAGVALAASAHHADTKVTRHFGSTDSASYRPGAIIGGLPFQLGTAFAAYAIGRSTNNSRVMSLGDDLIRAQVMAEVLTVGIKQGTRRSRPEGAGFSFPSGHTTAAFASATVIERHFGWKFGAPAYALATYVAASRVEMKRHYLSDVAFGAALGIVAGRTVTIGHDHKFALTPLASMSGSPGAAAGLTWVGRQ